MEEKGAVRSTHNASSDVTSVMNDWLTAVITVLVEGSEST